MRHAEDIDGGDCLLSFLSSNSAKNLLAANGTLSVVEVKGTKADWAPSGNFLFSFFFSFSSCNNILVAMTVFLKPRDF